MVIAPVSATHGILRKKSFRGQARGSPRCEICLYSVPNRARRRAVSKLTGCRLTASQALLKGSEEIRPWAIQSKHDIGLGNVLVQTCRRALGGNWVGALIFVFGYDFEIMVKLVWQTGDGQESKRMPAEDSSDVP